MTGDRSQLVNFVQKFLGTVKFGNDHVAKIMGYGDNNIGNVTISRRLWQPSVLLKIVPLFAYDMERLQTQSSVIPQDVRDDNLDMEVAHVGNDPLFGVPIPEVTSTHAVLDSNLGSTCHMDLEEKGVFSLRDWHGLVGDYNQSKAR
nr:integrase, catalytic region, zinc finger, CCHC-type, peptidase aspartic, catalytic [Tanacetum cinerariifolium]